MKVINYGSNYEIYANDLKTYDKLPAQTYKVRFNPMSGFSLAVADDFKLKESKVYGDRLVKIEKVLHTFKTINRSLGVILSGDKGIGKSLFTQILSQRAIEEGMPVILITEAYPGIAEFIDSIDQESLILFDEFEKVFNDRDGRESQEKLLSLFDGLSQRKRIYALTVNNLNRVNDFMLNRPGRFHYHLRFDYPDADEIRTYLQDKLDKAYYGEIDSVVKFSRRIKLNYDCLRAIALELSFGISFGEAIADLNILNIENQYYTVTIQFEGGLQPVVINSLSLNLFEDRVSFGSRTKEDSIYFAVSFNSKDLQVGKDETIDILGKNVNVDVYLDDEDDEKYNDLAIKSIMFKQAKTNTYGYGNLV